MIQIESLLSARLFMSPQRVGDRLFLLSNLSGHLSLYAMDVGGSVPEPLLPSDIALQNPALVVGYSFYVLPDLEQILVLIDQNGDENYQPMMVPIDGGIPQSPFGDAFDDYRVHLLLSDKQKSIAYFAAESRSEAVDVAFRADLASGELEEIRRSQWGNHVMGANADHTKLIIVDGYTFGDTVMYLWEQEHEELKLLHGKPIEEREEGEQVPLNRIGVSHFTENDRGVLFFTSIFDDMNGIAYLRLDGPTEPKKVSITGLRHEGLGELYDAEHGLEHLDGNRYLLHYNIDGCSWAYEAVFDEDALEMQVDRTLWGEGQFVDGVLQSSHYDRASNGYVISFSTATSPAQIYTLNGGAAQASTRERILGIPTEWLSAGEDASYESFDGLMVSARLYLPAEQLGFEGPRPLVYYIHGGPQSQERPDFTWFSMPLIQYLTLHGFGVFVPNVRGSTGYGLSYMKHVDRDWGGQDRLDHVHAMNILKDDPRVDSSRTGLVGRSYGGYMTLMLAGRHPELWSAAVDMFGPYDLFTFSERIPPTWKPYFKLAIGDPDDPEDRKLLEEMSPKTYLDELACPMLVIQGGNDPRVVAQESRDLVADLSAKGKEIDILVFEDEGHDVLKYDNRVRCYNAITEFFQQKLMDGSS
ncbi:MAG: prolyl oligopeptidase family serine peptidase [Anaerolineales bacterium]